VYPADAQERLRAVFPRLIYVDAATLATRVGNIRASNVVVLGALSTGLDLPAEAWHEAVVQSVPPKHKDLNLRAFEEGRNQS
jgi:indolepyruvate ferredoxin oxidoreductase beta subunit